MTQAGTGHTAAGGAGAGQEPADPSMEDILASIRRILNDGEEQAGTAEAAGATGGAAEEDDVFQLDSSMMIDEAKGRQAPEEAMMAQAGSIPVDDSEADDLAAFEAAAAQFRGLEEEEEFPPLAAVPAAPRVEDDRREAPPAAEPMRASEGDGLLAPEAGAAAADSLAMLRGLHARSIPVNRGSGPTLEDLVRDEMRPMLKAWLDEYLPPLVERLVRAEIERVSALGG